MFPVVSYSTFLNKTTLYTTNDDDDVEQVRIYSMSSDVVL